MSKDLSGRTLRLWYRRAQNTALMIPLSFPDRKQNTPHFTGEVIAGILTSTIGYKQMFCALLVERESAPEKQSD